MNQNRQHWKGRVVADGAAWDQLQREHAAALRPDGQQAAVVAVEALDRRLAEAWADLVAAQQAADVGLSGHKRDVVLGALQAARDALHVARCRVDGAGYDAK